MLLSILTSECVVKEEVCITNAVIHSGSKAPSGISTDGLLAESVNTRHDLSGLG